VTTTEQTTPRTVLVTGASAGVGKSCVDVFSSEGWNAVAATRHPERLSQYECLPQVLAVGMDVTDDNSINNALRVAVEAFGGIDVVVNNAGYGHVGLLEATPMSAIKELFDVNLFGCMRVCRAILPHFRAREGGVIVNVSSGAGILGVPMANAYSSSKFAIEGFSEAFSHEAFSQGVLVKIVEPGGILGTNFAVNTKVASGSATVKVAYASFMARAHQTFSAMRSSASASSDAVAQVIYRAATDGSDQLRYVATEDIAEAARLRRSSSEEEFMAAMRQRFRR
jgi:NAD(P)-dependent dehydrogenase (short-subunit alcohol dehydrogenase family)